MFINSDYSERIVLRHQDLPWTASPEAGVDRRMLDRTGGEVARATSVVRYQPGARFSSHTHDLGEEILVLEGIFSVETGVYPAGSYLMNPT
ncbi:MAG: cupin domain-containing protein, partial [Steroidobacteraceae bacterium]